MGTSRRFSCRDRISGKGRSFGLNGTLRLYGGILYLILRTDLVTLNSSLNLQPCFQTRSYERISILFHAHKTISNRFFNFAFDLIDEALVNNIIDKLTLDIVFHSPFTRKIIQWRIRGRPPPPQPERTKIAATDPAISRVLISHSLSIERDY